MSNETKTKKDVLKNNTASVKDSKYNSLIEKINQLSLLELKDFVQELQKYFNIDPNQLVSVSSGKASEEKKSSLVNVIVEEVGQSKIAVIKVVGKITGKGLLEAKKMLDNVPFTIAEKQTEEAAKKLKADLIVAGATVEIK